MKLTAKYLQSITKPGRYYDDAAPGLFVLAQSHTRKRDGETMIRLSFVQRVTVNGKRVDLGLGSPKWGAVTLTEARAKAIANYRIARNGGDPRQGAKPVPTFADGLDAVLAIQAPTWRNPKSEPQWRASLRDYAGALMAKPVDRIGPADVLAVVGPIWNAKRGNGAASEATDRQGHGLGSRRRVPGRQSGEHHRGGAAEEREPSRALPRASLRARRRRSRGRAGDRRMGPYQARARIPGADGGALG